jgi:hypothetical protein
MFNSAVVEKIDVAVESLLGEIVRSLQELVRIPSVAGRVTSVLLLSSGYDVFRFFRPADLPF